ncbi:MAG TPA: aldehyde dehydrogenase family protein [Steroidobacteraceae bacterium]|nr:aldehyde dehydrogenase family protein [Steroidobacteraceae bacterium]
MTIPFRSDLALIGGEWRAAAGGATLPVEDPSSGATVGTIARSSAADVDAAVGAARAAGDGAWGRLAGFERGRLLAALGRRVLERAEELAALETLDVGKPSSQARADALALARYLEFYGGAADKLHGATIPYLGDYTIYTLREPHGVTAHIIPWNYPMQIIGRSVGAALAAGNAVVIKPAEEASLTTLAFARLALEAGLPAGAVNVVPGLGEEAGAALAAHPGVNHVSFTGSVEVGIAVQSAAARHVAPVTLELGGKSPQLVFDDADLEAALPVLVRAGLQNAGQTCSASSRLLLQRGIYARTVEALAARYRQLRAGPAARDLDLGPLISAAQRRRIEAMVAAGRAAGVAELARGEVVADAPAGGHYLAPLLLGPVAPGDPLAQEEIFGPVQVVLPFDTEEEAVALANGTRYGLVAGVWTRDAGRQHRLARRLRAGQVFLNDYGAAGGVELPFGGVGWSGHGREKGMEALYGFTTLKTVAARHR